jgi:hypothetical protein
MPALVAGIHDFFFSTPIRGQNVHGRDKPGHDELGVGGGD